MKSLFPMTPLFSSDFVNLLVYIGLPSIAVVLYVVAAYRLIVNGTLFIEKPAVTARRLEDLKKFFEEPKSNNGCRSVDAK
jgi:hypothetical protein